MSFHDIERSKLVNKLIELLISLNYEILDSYTICHTIANEYVIEANAIIIICTFQISEYSNNCNDCIFDEINIYERDEENDNILNKKRKCECENGKCEFNVESIFNLIQKRLVNY